ncbi:MAG: hypothetical protein N2204_03930 [Anaerolineae bacterium]|nr:hypothetical protein [Anaerolineae bacterium]
MITTIVQLSLIVLIALLLIVLLARAFSRPNEAPAAAHTVMLVRSPRTADGREETRLLINDKLILTATNDGVRLAAYTEEVEQLEALAARIASALGVSVSFTRLPAKGTDAEGIAVRSLPRIEENEEPEAEPPARPKRSQAAM